MLKQVGNVVAALINNSAKMATEFISDKQIVRAIRKDYNGKFAKDKIEIVLTLGKPNFVERDMIKKFKKAGEPFPVKKVQLVFLPKK